MQRCATLFTPKARGKHPMPVVVYLNNYACNTLWKLGMQYADPLLVAARRFSFAVLALSSPTEKWTFGNDGVVSARFPMPCDAANTDLAYLLTALEILQEAPSVFQCAHASGSTDFLLSCLCPPLAPASTIVTL